jgi:hypothetical protein
MTEPTKGRGGRPDRAGLPAAAWLVVGAMVAGAGVFCTWVARHQNGELVFWWGMLGDSVAPVTALFSAGALGVALWTMHEQQLEGQKAERRTEAQLDRMTEQLKEFAKSANAQARLAESQQKLAEAQEAANELTRDSALQEARRFSLRAAQEKLLLEAQVSLAAAQKEANDIADAAIFAVMRGEHAQRGNSVATIVAALATTKAIIAQAKVSSVNGGTVKTELRSEITSLEARWTIEQQQVGVVEAILEGVEKDFRERAAKKKQQSEAQSGA